MRRLSAPLLSYDGLLLIVLLFVLRVQEIFRLAARTHRSLIPKEA